MPGSSERLDTGLFERVRIPMRDGTRLSGILYRAADGPRPVLLVRTPYGEPLSRTLPILPALDAGFAVLVQDCRGTGDSEGGVLRTFENERTDGLDTIGWVVRQPWCDGKVAMFGASYLGMVQLAVSGDRPEGLAAIATAVTPDDYRDGLVYRQGAFQLGPGIAWHLMKAAQTLGEAAARGEDVSARMGALMALTRDVDAAHRRLPLTDRPGVADVLPSWRTWLEKEEDPDYWHGISYAERRTNTAVPGLHVGGWFDLFLRGTLDNYTTLAKTSAAPQHLIVGPWSHTDQTGVVGEVFYNGGAAQAIRLEEQQFRFLRESVDGTPTSLPPVQIYVMGADRWRTENEWPPARTDWQTWYLAADGALGRDMPADGVAEYVHDPHDPVPTVGGAILMAGSPDGGLAYQPGSRDQRVLDGPVGGPQLAAAWNLLAPGGLVQNIGWASDEPARFAPHELLFIGPSKTMSTVGDTRDVGPDLATLLRFTAAGRLSPEAGWRGPWENFAEAARALLDRRIAGKAVLDVTAEPAG